MLVTDRFTLSSAPIKKVKRVQFSVCNPEEVKKYSVAKIDSADTYVSGKPRSSGLLDPRMGTMDRGIRCTTDGSEMQDCPGYFGHIELAKPMYHVGFMKTILKVLRCIGYHSSKLLIDKEDPRFERGQKITNKQLKLKFYTAVCKTKKIDEFTGAPQPSYKLNGFKIQVEFPSSKGDDYQETERKQDLTAEKAYEILKKVSDEDYEILGFDTSYARPDWFILTILPVPPPPVRPSVMMDTSLRCEDDLTHKLAEIIRANNDLHRQEQNGAPQHIINEFSDLLQFHITTYFDNTLPGVPRSNQRSGRPIKSISERLKGKEGRIRGNLMGKRVDFSARTVITGDANIGIDELGVPWSIAQLMTYPETVTPYNYEKLKKLVENGPHPPPGEPGARYIIREDGKRLDLRYLKKESDRHIEIGYKVERHMMDGDVVLFNRQPSLHKMSMMGHKVKILPYSTFRLNLAVTSPYNADFDGDEMNMHLPQTPETRAETLELMMVPKMVVSPQANKPVIGIVQDSLLGCRLMTKRDTFIEKEDFMNILLHLEGWNGRVPLPTILKASGGRAPLWAGKQAISVFLPNINLSRKSAWYDNDEEDDMSPEDSQVLIHEGELLTGTLCKKTLGTSVGGLVHIIWMEKGPNECRRFLNNVQYAVNHWLLMHGFSIGIGDTFADDETMDSIQDIIEIAKEDVRKLIEKFQSGQLEGQPGRTNMESFEHKVNEVLNKARDDAGKKAQASLKYTNNIVRMVTAGSKGSYINVSQMTACVGQQNVEGKRIRFGFQQRSLPHFTKDDYGPESKGFVKNSYLKGLAPQEFFFHAMGGREGLIDTAIKTSSTGYIQRRLVKAMEDLIIKYDGTVRNSSGEVVQFLYGDDGMDGTGVEAQQIEHYNMDNISFDRTYKIPTGKNIEKPEYICRAAWSDITCSFEIQDLLEWEYQTLKEELLILRTEILPNGESRVHLPVNIKRLIWNAQRMFKCKNYTYDATNLHPAHVIRTISNLSDKISVVPGNESLCREAQKSATYLFICHVRAILSAKRTLREFRLTHEAFDWIVGEIVSKFHFAKCHPGECIGTIAAQSVGEPTTQMTLNTFHYAGVSAKNVTLGVPRLSEIINVAKNIKTPSLSVYLLGDARLDKAAAKEMQCKLEFTKLKNVVQTTEIWYDPDIMTSIVPEDVEWVTDYMALADDLELKKFSPWVLRIVLSKELTLDKNLGVAKIAERINQEYGDLLESVNTDDNADELVIRIRIKLDDDGLPLGAETDYVDYSETLRKLEMRLMELNLQGVPGITKVYIREERTKVYDPFSNTGFKESAEWILDTEGVNLMEVMSQEGVDYTKTVSNHLIEVFSILGIEAVRTALLKELRGVIEFDGSYVNYRHLAILCDTMTYRGHMMSITRHGINRNEKSPIAQSSFEETVEVLFRAATNAEVDRIKGVSENILLGQMCPIGTGCFDLLLNDDALADAIQIPELGYSVPETTAEAINYQKSITQTGTNSLSPKTIITPNAAAETAKMTPIELTDVAFSPLFGFSDDPGTPNPEHTPSFEQLSMDSSGNSSHRDVSPGWSPTSPGYSPDYSPGSPNIQHPYSPTSPKVPGQSPGYSPSSPKFSPNSPIFTPKVTTNTSSHPTHATTSPVFSPTILENSSEPTPKYSPTSPVISPGNINITGEKRYSPISPAHVQGTTEGLNSSAPLAPSPEYLPASPPLSPSAVSPSYSPNISTVSPNYSPTSPILSPGSHGRRRTSGVGSSSAGLLNSSPVFSPPSPAIGSGTSPGYTPTSPILSPHGGRDNEVSEASPAYSPSSPDSRRNRLSDRDHMQFTSTSPSSNAKDDSLHSPQYQD